MMTISFFAGIVPLVPFVVAIAIGGDVGASISIFLYKQYYPCVIILGSVAIIVGLVAIYVGKKEGKPEKKSATNQKNEK